MRHDVPIDQVQRAWVFRGDLAGESRLNFQERDAWEDKHRAMTQDARLRYKPAWVLMDERK